MSIVFAILLFSLLIFVHELGHFVTAKLSGVQVNEFALFMGPAIYQKKLGETIYSRRCIPIGGYCAMEGEEEDTDNPRSFQKAIWWKRLIILVAGSVMNYVTGVLIFAIVFAPAQQFIMPTVASIEEGCLIAGENGIQVGDTFLELDGEKIYVQSDFSTVLALNPGDVHDLVLERGGEKIVLEDFKMEKALFPNEDGSQSERFGFSFSVVKATLGEKVKYVWNSTLNVIRNVRLSLQMLITGKAGLQDMSGPGGIVQVMSETAEQSADTFSAIMNMLYFGGFIAINLAIMNLLPIPALDGGRVVCLLITTIVEVVTGKKINPKYEGYLHAAGMILLLGLMAIILFKDIFVIFKG